MDAAACSSNNPVKALTSRLFQQRSGNEAKGKGKMPLMSNQFLPEELVNEFHSQQMQQQPHHSINHPMQQQQIMVHHQRPSHEWFQDYEKASLQNNDHFQDNSAFTEAFDMHFNQVIQSQMKAEQVWQEEFAQNFSNALTVNDENKEGEMEAWDKAFNWAATSGNPINNITVEEFLNQKQEQQQDLDAEDAEYFNHLQKEYEDIWKQASSHDANPMYSMLESENGGNLASLAERPIPSLHSYTFNQQNPYLSVHENNTIPLKSIAEWKAQAMEAYSQGEPIRASQILEACLQEHQERDQDQQISHIWDLLGTWQSENENEVQAMAAFEACLKIDPQHTHAIQNLAICYTNEGLYREADALLCRWLSYSYPDIPIQGDSNLIDHFTRCLSRNPRNADLQMALGVLFYHRDEMDKAVDCFQTALSITPNDHRLWNRLGATLANSNQSERAIEAYEKALTLNPAYIRARCNLGVSCVHMGLLKQAIENFLSGLAAMQVQQQQQHVQVTGHQQRTNLLWIHLKRAIEMCDQYEDLQQICRNADNEMPPLALFRKYFDF